MKKMLLCVALLCSSQLALALAPYLQGGKLAAAEPTVLLDQVERKLVAEGFTVIGRHTPKGMAQHASLVLTDPTMLEVIRSQGGAAVIASGIRVGVKSDGSVSYMNPDYWYRAYLRGQFKGAQPAVSSVQTRLAKALGEGAGFGGDVADADLANYRYMFGMERFDSANSELKEYPSFGAALAAVQENLARGSGSTRRVYEVVMAAQNVAVFGVAMDDAATGEAWWAAKIGADHIAGLPYELYIVGGKVYAPYARYRIALAWPALGMGQFIGIVNAPEAIRTTLLRVAGGGN